MLSEMESLDLRRFQQRVRVEDLEKEIQDLGPGSSSGIRKNRAATNISASVGGERCAPSSKRISGDME